MISQFISKLYKFLLERVSRNHAKLSYDIGPNKQVLRGECYFSFSKSIIEYAIQNKEKITDLKKNLDPKSKELIDTIFNRLYYIYTHNILERDKIITKKEIKKYIKIRKFLNDYKKKNDLYIDNIDETIFYYHHGLKYIPKNFLEKLINKDFIDGGAYIGDSALMFEDHYEQRKIYSFEPDVKNYNHLIKTIKLNNLKKVIPVKLGLGNEERLVKLSGSDHESFISKEGKQEIKLTSIDNFVNKNNLSVGLIKLDVEGYGLEAIKGAKKTINTYKPILLISIYHCAEEFFEIKNFIEKQDKDYHIIIRKLAPLKPFFDTTLIAWLKSK